MSLFSGAYNKFLVAVSGAIGTALMHALQSAEPGQVINWTPEASTIFVAGLMAAIGVEHVPNRAS